MFSRLLKIAHNPQENWESTFLLVGLGNPGREHHGNRHNVGFMIIDKFSEEVGISMSRYQSKALVGSGIIEKNKLILAKPQTYMNLSGDSVVSLIRFYKIPLEKFLVVYDDLDLPFGTIRLRASGGTGGHNGMTSIQNRLGTQDFPRLRFGIGRPPGKMDAASYVLQDFSKDEKFFLTPMVGTGVDAVRVFILSGLEAAMNQFNNTGVKE
jgi:peptidyl-tRNA hydrolase, PTH1 family